MGNDQALFDRFPISVIKIFLRHAVLLFRIKFPVEHVLDAFDDAGELKRGKAFFDL